MLKLPFQHIGLEKEEYTNYGEFLDDLRLLFQNAIKFNEQYKDIDITSMTVYNAAAAFEDKVISNLRLNFTIAKRYEYKFVVISNS